MNEQQRESVARAAGHGVRRNRLNIASWTVVLLAFFGSIALIGEALILALETAP